MLNLKDNLFLSLDNVPEKAKKLITVTSLQFVSESESKWYVHQQDETSFRDYKTNRWLGSAKDSLRSAIQKLIGKDNNPDKIKFSIFSIG